MNNEQKHTSHIWEHDEPLELTLIHRGFTEQDARRIVACVNACEGISTELLETRLADPYTSARGYKQQLDEVAKQRDELLAELQSIITLAPSGDRPNEDDYDDTEIASSKGYDAGQHDAAHKCADLAHAAIAKVQP